MFPTYHAPKDKTIVPSTSASHNLTPIDVMATFNPNGKFRIDYIRIELPNDERVTVKLVEMKREVVEAFWINQEYTYFLRDKICSVIIAFNIAEHKFYLKNNHEFY